MKEDIIGGLKNAMDRGYTLDAAIQSFINAGYSVNEVKEAASNLSTGALSILQPSSPQLIQDKAIQEINPEYHANPLESNKMNWKIFLLIVLLIVILGLGALLLIFKENAIEFLSNLF